MTSRKSHHFLQILKLLTPLALVLLILSCQSSERKNNLLDSASNHKDSTEFLFRNNLLNELTLSQKDELIRDTFSNNSSIKDSLEFSFLLSKLNYVRKYTSSKTAERNINIKKGNWDVYSNLLYNLSAVYSMNFQNIEILEELIRSEKGNIIPKALLVDAYYLLGDYYKTEDFDLVKSVNYFEKALATNKSETSFLRTQTLARLILLYMVKRDLGKSIVYAEKLKKATEKSIIPNYSINLKSSYLNAFINFRADNEEKYLEELKEIIQSINSKNCLHEIQEAYKYLISELSYNKRFDEAEKFLVDLEAIVNKCHDSCNLSKIKGQIYSLTSQHKLAIIELKKAFNFIVKKKPYDQMQMGTVLHHLNKSYFLLGDFENSLNIIHTISSGKHPESIKKFDPSQLNLNGDTSLTYSFISYKNFAEVYYTKYIQNNKLSDLRLAQKSISRSAQLIKNELFTLDEDVLLNLFFYSKDVFELGIRIHFEIYKKSPSQSSALNLLQWSQNNKSRISFFDNSDELGIINTQVKYLKSRIQFFRHSREHVDSILHYKNELQTLSQELNLKNLLLDNNELHHTLSKIPSDVTILDMNHLTESLQVNIITSDGITPKMIPWSLQDEEDLINLIAMTNNPNSSISSLKKLASSVYSQLFSDVVPTSRLYIVPNKLFHNLSFDVLNQDKNYLVESSNIIYLRNLNELKNQDFYFDKVDKVEGFFFSNRKTITESRSTMELPGNIKEAKALLSQFPECTINSGANNTVTKYYESLGQNLDVIHIASHATASDKNRNDLCLYFRKSDLKLDSIYAYELLGKKINSKLVVLSACETSKGKSYDGEGQFDIKRYFLSIGAQNVISNLWEFDDFAASAYFDDFYSQKNTISISKRFNNSKLKLLNSKKYSHPYYWAGITLDQ